MSSLYVLHESAAGYGLFKATDKKMLKDGSRAADFEKPEKLVDMLKLKKFTKFDSAAQALEEAVSLKDGQVPEILKAILESIKSEKKATVAVADVKLGTAISQLPDLDLGAIAGNQTLDLFRGIREHIPSLIPGLEQETLDRMALGLSHSMARHHMKFSVDKVDSMIIQAVRLLDDMDKELNLYAMRTKEWYGWHFPEMAKLLNDNLAFARVVQAGGPRSQLVDTDLSEILSSDTEAAIKAAAGISMGTEITERDLENVQLMAAQVIAVTEYRAELQSYLETRMRAIAPNVTALVGFMVAARLIAHTGSLIGLAKSPGSTIQVLGAEKALFRALKTKHDTPKYGLIYHTSLIGQTTGRNKGKIARMLAAKAALSLRVDALGDEEVDDAKDDEERAVLGLTSRIKLENRIRKLEGKPLLAKGTNVTPSGDIVAPGAFSLKETRQYNTEADGVNGDSEPKDKKKKEKKSKKSKSEEEDEDMEDADDVEVAATPAKSTKFSEADFEKFADTLGISAKKLKKKYEKGQVIIENGTPKVVSKKDLKADENDTPSKKTSAPAEPASEGKKKKRKHEDDEGETESKKEKKQKKKKRQSLDA
ncbi:hypothetical protein B0I35DRAFT_451010 [Stachybotrys elegans]|uniref:Nucleolar protein 58 n=1 Tax=Stachybotrys elegans TaxID=80388 RepID=A0A8K0SNV0_9HYPO|nr:hypothetical protein B0I35DRAFT_451010 [Stachybotrys elegans]